MGFADFTVANPGQQRSDDGFDRSRSNLDSSGGVQRSRKRSPVRRTYADRTKRRVALDVGAHELRHRRECFKRSWENVAGTLTVTNSSSQCAILHPTLE